MTTLPSVDGDRLNETLADLIRIPSVNPGWDAGSSESAVATYVAERLSQLGITARAHEVAPGRPNVIGQIPGGSGATIMLAGHLDTVGVDGMEEPFAPRMSGGRMYGRGAADMKGGLAAILQVAAELVRTGHKPAGDLYIAALCDEELGMIGSKAIGSDGPNCDFGIVAEPTELSVCPSHRGQIGVLVRTRGVAAHSSAPELGVNAITHMAKVIEALGGYQETLAAGRSHSLCGYGSVSAGVIAGGTSASVVPDVCELEIDRRTIPGEDYQTIREELRSILDEIAQADEGFRYEIEGPTWDIPSLDLAADAPAVEAVIAAHREIVGSSPAVRAFSAATDAPNLGFPAIVYGPGSLAQAHTVDEYVDLAEVATATRVMLHLVTRDHPGNGEPATSHA